MSLGSAIVIGSSGQVAKALTESLAKRAIPTLHTSSSSRPGAQALDLGSAVSIRDFFSANAAALAGRRVEVFLNGALTHVDKCEEERELCVRVNEQGPALVAEECRARGYKLTFFSTEYVFGEAEYRGGKRGPFSETDEPAPTSFYGKCKWEAEKKIQAVLPSALIVRTTMVFSWDALGNNFLMQYLKRLEEIRQGANPPIFKIPLDQISTPTYSPILGEDTCRLREKGVEGIVNLVGSDLVSRKDLLERVIAVFGYDRESSLKGFRFLPTAELGQKAKRPLTAGLRTDKAASLGIEPWSLDRAFAHAAALRARSL